MKFKNLHEYFISDMYIHDKRCSVLQFECICFQLLATVTAPNSWNKFDFEPYYSSILQYTTVVKVT